MEALGEPIGEEPEENGRRSLEKMILLKSRKESYKICRKVYYNAFKPDYLKNPFKLDHGDEALDRCNLIFYDINEMILLMKQLHLLPLVDANIFALENLPKKNKHFHHLLNASFPRSVNKLILNAPLFKSCKISYYFANIMQNSFRVCNKIEFDSFILSKNQVKRLIISFKHVKLFTLIRCRISIPEPPDFSKSLKNAQICSINLYSSLKARVNNQEATIELFENLIKGLATSDDLKLALKEMNLTCNGLTKTAAQEILESNGFGHISLTL
ncbi:unnamed protein product [Moneuplotes crassus]|uniref:Uncharacterized protein n=1 Tax=Euplotes crassus TaxID=5936 RepID=A0AAD2D057_EUPCR|nr:unnamed protein product [Moneuplotes crassus]